MEDVQTAEAPPVVKAPRKPRPSELAAKAAKAAGKKAVKPKAKPAKKKAKKATRAGAVVRKAKKAAKGKTKSKAPARKLVRTARLDLRCTPSERALAIGLAKKKDTTVTDLVMQVLRKMK